VAPARRSESFLHTLDGIVAKPEPHGKPQKMFLTLDTAYPTAMFFFLIPFLESHKKNNRWLGETVDQRFLKDIAHREC